MSSPFRAVRLAALLFLCLGLLPTAAQISNLAVRVMAANITSGNGSYQTAGINIFKGLKPDIVAIQEFKYGTSSSNEINSFVSTTFGTNFVYFRESSESGYSIPNGVISRWPILSSSSWDDPEVNDRGVAWAQIDLPGTNDLYVVSVHMFNGGTETERNNEAVAVRSNIFHFFPTNSWVIVAGDCNTDDRLEAAITTYKTFLSDTPVPTDLISGGDADTNEPRSKDYDYVLPSFSLTNLQVPVVIGPDTFPKGLVFDSTVYNNNYTLDSVPFVQSGDSHVDGMEHMAVIKDFLLPVFGTNAGPVAPSITAQPLSQTNTVGSTALLSVTASGTAPLAHQWRFFGTNLPGATATNLSFASLTTNDAGPYTVVITNSVGSVTSSVATLTVTVPLTNTPPAITTQPASQSVATGGTASFFVIATGTAPLAHQWQLHGTNLPGATATNYSKPSVTTNDAGPYTVIITNVAGAITSSVVTLTVTVPGTNSFIGTLAGWNVSNQINFGISPLPPTTNAPNLTIIGLTRGSGVLTNQSASPKTWGGSGFDTGSSTNAVIAGDFAFCGITATAGFNVSFSAIGRFDYRRSNTGPTSGVLQYQLGTASFTDIVGVNYPSTAGASLGPIDLSGIAALQNVGSGTNVTFRIVNFNGATGGTWYILELANSSAPDFAIDGSISPITLSGIPASAPALSTPALNAGLLEFTVTGTTGTNYIVQASTNLALSNWFSLRTNAAPFSFTDSNLNSAPQKFYRGMLAP